MTDPGPARAAPDIPGRIRRVRERMEGAARRAGRDPAGITLVAVSKTVPVARIREAVEAGIGVFGENRVQEARRKITQLPSGLDWHMVGYLQRNKARAAARLFRMVQSVDRLPLGEVLSEAAKAGGETLPVLIQVNLGGEATKAGADPETVPRLAAGLAALEGIRVRGLMAIPPPFPDPERARPHFRALRELAGRVDRLQIPGVEMRELSMGMTGDFEVAIEEGATLIRVGTAVFGERPAPAGGAGNQGGQGR